jgi:hypothetical protein
LQTQFIPNSEIIWKQRPDFAALETGDFPARVMLTLHIQRWTDNKLRWVQEFIAQNLSPLLHFLHAKYLLIL